LLAAPIDALLQTAHLPFTNTHHHEVMPYVNIQITAGATRAQKASLVRDVTESLVRELHKRPEHIHVVIQEITEENWGFAGQLTDDWRRAHGASKEASE
jgi:4-oxalocrotonate tautomerase